ncbi:hypothetical protein TUM19329_13300 [Legionella antarctica]|uniref:Acyltransferase 3 domain-containing protein n=1 Tax=Legionella antarctica TaxID=2708020 RepID=A0A6F8T3F2_9GAMM|nr:acyltransferase [Legionella antarctica]BCA94969.1 hypothetical protein TUM19329_13300 [Legionella antarctica]
MLQKDVINVLLKKMRFKIGESWSTMLDTLSKYRAFLHAFTVLSSIALVFCSLFFSSVFSPNTYLIFLFLVLVCIGLTTAEYDARNQLSLRQEKDLLFKIQPSKYIPELDGIRGYACLSVFFAHCCMGLIKPNLKFLYNIEQFTNALLLGGVDLFFVLSGFLIGGILIDSRGSSHYFKRFWIRRIARIFPVLYALLASYCIALIVSANFDLPILNKWLLADPKPPLWTYATFLQSFHIAAGGYGGPRWVGITWSLAIEEQFYFLFPLAVYFLSKRSLLFIVFAGIIIAPILRDVFERLYGYWYAPYVLLPSRVDGLMFGVLVAIIIRNASALEQAFKFRRLLDVVAIAIVYLIATSHPILRQIWTPPLGGDFPPLKQTCLAILSSILILRVFLYRKNTANFIWRWRLLALFGLISYPLYMYHQAINGLIHGYFFGDEPVISSYSQLLASIPVMVLSILLATISYIWMEKPIRRWGHQISNKWAPKNQMSLNQVLG